MVADRLSHGKESLAVDLKNQKGLLLLLLSLYLTF
jgi:hypothetical protein